MDYSERYKVDLVNALHNIDTVTVERVIQCLKQARVHNRRIFICGSEQSGVAGAQFLAEALRHAKPFKGRRLRVLNLNTQVTQWTAAETPSETSPDRLIVEELKSFGEPGDVVIGISGSKSIDSVVKALEYANWINCRTVAITGSDDARMGAVSSILLKVSAARPATFEDAMMSICRLIGHSFADSCAAQAPGTT